MIQSFKSSKEPCRIAPVTSLGLFVVGTARNLYWKRLWITQEILLAKGPVIHIGARVLDGHFLLKMPIAALSYDKRDPEPSEIASVIREILPRANTKHFVTIARMMDFSSTTFKPCPLSFMLLSNRGKKCADPRDLVYGLLGLTEKSTSQKLSIELFAFRKRSISTFSTAHYREHKEP
jgi:hypothetical protein